MTISGRFVLIAASPISLLPHRPSMSATMNSPAADRLELEPFIEPGVALVNGVIDGRGVELEKREGVRASPADG